MRDPGSEGGKPKFLARFALRRTDPYQRQRLSIVIQDGKRHILDLQNGQPAGRVKEPRARAFSTKRIPSRRTQGDT
jgi:hypothetical protein